MGWNTFTISDFIAILEHSQQAFHDLMSASYSAYTQAIRADHSEMRAKTIAIEVENKKILDENKLNQHQRVKQDQAMKTLLAQHEVLKKELDQLKIQANNFQENKNQASSSNPIQPSSQNNQFGTWNNNTQCPDQNNQSQSQPPNATFGGSAFSNNNFGG